jgi:hypothetical protein
MESCQGYFRESGMDGHESVIERWALTDEEWCELCFMILEVGTNRERLEQTLLSEERPTLHQLWVAMSAYRDSSDDFFDYLAARLRTKAGIEHRQIV